MDASPLASAEERRIRAARRFGRIGLVITLVWLLLVPAYVWFLGEFAWSALWPVVVLYVAAIGLHLWRIRSIMRSLGRPAPLWFVIAACAVGLALVGFAMTTGFTGFAWGLVAAVLLGDVVGGLRARWIAVWVVAATVVVFALAYAVSSAQGYPVEWAAAFLAGLTAFYVASVWSLDVERLWWLKAVTDMDDARRAAAELATARERLRLADDLHDILGHALEVVAFKSELAARLLPVDADRARGELEDVQTVARRSLDEVRALVRETRRTDLVDELAGARAVLDSGGVALVVRGDPTTLGPTARDVLGRVLREAMTNVLRHAQPSHCTIEIEVDGGDARLRVVNDGALPAGDDTGTGLVALSRYLADHSGRLDAGPAPDGTFRVDAVLPGASR